MSDLDDFKEGMSSTRATRKGLGSACYIDGLIVFVIAIIGLCMNNSYEGMSSGTSSAIIFGTAALLLFTGYFLMKDMAVGDILAWISAIFTTVWGVLTSVDVIKGDMITDLYFLFTGVLMLIYLAIRTASEKRILNTSTVNELKDAASADSSSRKGIGFAALTDGIIVLIVAIVGYCLNRSYDGMSVGASAAIMFGIALLLCITAACMLKELKIGDILAWISAIFTTVWGIITSFGMINGDMIFKTYFLITGVLMLMFIASMTFESKKS